MSGVLLVAAIVAFCAAAWQWLPMGTRAWRPRRRNTRALRLSLPGMVEALAAALGSGLSLPLAFAEIAPTLDAELARTTRGVAARLALGARIPDALAEYGAVAPAQDIAPLVIVLSAFARSGGHVAPSLERVATLLRGRLALEEERAALTAQGRVSAIVLVALAPLGVVFFALAMPDYLASLFGEAIGLIGLAVVFETVGALCLTWRRSWTRSSSGSMRGSPSSTRSPAFSRERRHSRGRPNPGGSSRTSRSGSRSRPHSVRSRHGRRRPGSARS
jgi:tight adherence protein B